MNYFSHAKTTSSHHSPKVLAQQKNFTDTLHAVGIGGDPSPLTPDAKLRHENVALYMFIGLVVAFVFISTIIITVELYKNGKCVTRFAGKRSKEKGMKRLKTDDDSEVEMEALTTNK